MNLFMSILALFEPSFTPVIIVMLTIVSMSFLIVTWVLPMLSNKRKCSNTYRQKSIFDIVDEYKKEQISNGLRIRTAESNNARIKLVISLTGKNNLKEIRGRESRNAKDLLLKYPSNAHKKEDFYNLTPNEIVEKNKLLLHKLLSLGTVKGHLQATSSFFKWCIAMEYTDINPFAGLRLPKDYTRLNKKRHAFTSEQLKSIFSMQMYVTGKVNKNYQYWILLLLRYTGARLNELAQLYSDDVIKVDGIWCLKLCPLQYGQRLKNDNATRTIPIADQLIEHGFIEFSKSKNGHIFPELPLGKCGYGTIVSKWASYWRKKLGLGYGLDLHSFRHSFIRELKDLEINESLVAAICGHEHDGITYKRYGKDYSPKRLLEIVNLIDTRYTKDIATFKYSF